MRSFHPPSEAAFLGQRVDAVLREFFAAEMRRHTRNAVFSSLFQDTAEFVLRPGKRLRPLLFLKARALFVPEDSADNPALLAAAASLEMMHAFVLVHDDIIDRSERRRGEPTLHRLIEGRMGRVAERERTSQNLALVMGDLLFAAGQRCLLRSGCPEAAAMAAHALDCVFDTGVGEAEDVVFGVRDIARVSIADIEEMYRLKTTRYTFEAPLVLAGISARLPDEQRAALAEIAVPAGLAFQAENDLAEFEDSNENGAALSADLVEGKKTLLAGLAFSMLEDRERTVLQLCLNGAAASEGTVNKVRELIAGSGAVEKLRDLSDELFRETSSRIAASPLAAAAKEGLDHCFREIRALVARAPVAEAREVAA